MNPWIIAGAGAALALERMTYAIVWVQPARFVRCCRWIAPGRDPVDVLAWLFLAFKAIQVLVFIIWALVHGGTIAPASPDLSVLLGASALIPSADAFVFPSETDTAGNVVLEAQASGLPVLVSARGGPRENMLDGRSGHVVEAATPEAWLHRIAPLLEHAAYRKGMGAAARRYAESRSWPLALEPLYRLYRKVGGGQAPADWRATRTA